MSIVKSPQGEVLNLAELEVLVGTSPSGDDLRNAIHAVITKRFSNKHLAKGKLTFLVSLPHILNNVEYLARQYEAMKSKTRS